MNGWYLLFMHISILFNKSNLYVNREWNCTSHTHFISISLTTLIAHGCQFAVIVFSPKFILCQFFSASSWMVGDWQTGQVFWVIWSLNKGRKSLALQSHWIWVCCTVLDILVYSVAVPLTFNSGIYVFECNCWTEREENTLHCILQCTRMCCVVLVDSKLIPRVLKQRNIYSGG